MKKKIVKKTVKKIEKTKMKSDKSRFWIWIVGAFLIGGVFGFALHYTVANWDGFFAKCPNGAWPDKNGCCAGEIYTDAGDGWMVCCPLEGDNCFPPVK